MRGTLRSKQPLLLCELHDTKLGYREFVDSIDYRARVIDGESPELADADRNVHTIAWPRERDMAGVVICA
jgi:hypothetical protein